MSPNDFECTIHGESRSLSSSSRSSSIDKFIMWTKHRVDASHYNDHYIYDCADVTCILDCQCAKLH